MYSISDKVSVIHAITVLSKLFLLASRVQVIVKQRTAMALYTDAQIIFMDTLAQFERLTYLDQVPMSFMLAIHTEGFLCSIQAQNNGLHKGENTSYTVPHDMAHRELPTYYLLGL